MGTIEQKQRVEIKRLRDENETLRGVCLKMAKASEEYRERMRVLEAAFDILRSEG